MRTPASILLGAVLAVTTVLPAAPASAFPGVAPEIGAASGVTPVVAQSKKQVAAKFKRQKVRLVTDEAPGTVIVDTNNKFLYYVEGKNRATRYGIGVGREGFGWSGVVKVGRKEEWPGWTPPAEMRRREAKKGRILPAYQPGGEDNPLGARALYLYQGGNDTMFRIHGTNQPWSIGQAMSSGCVRMLNHDVIDLYGRVKAGDRVWVIQGRREA